MSSSTAKANSGRSGDSGSPMSPVWPENMVNTSAARNSQTYSGSLRASWVGVAPVRDGAIASTAGATATP